MAKSLLSVLLFEFPSVPSLHISTVTHPSLPGESTPPSTRPEDGMKSIEAHGPHALAGSVLLAVLAR